MASHRTRRDFLKHAGAAALAFGGARAFAQDAPSAAAKRDYKISLAAWSLHRTLGKGEGKRDLLDLPRTAREDFGIEAIELVSGMLSSREQDYLDQLAKNAAEHDVKILLTMVDGEGNIGDARESRREHAIERHKFWIHATAGLGGHAIRMNWTGADADTVGNAEKTDEFIARSVPALRALCDYGDSKNINVLIENHGGPSSQPEAMVKLMKSVDHPRFGTLPDFGNFPDTVDIYEGIDALMPHAKAVSAKCYDFDPETGEDPRIDFGRMIEIVHDKHGYTGYIGIEYEGRTMPEYDGIRHAKALLEKLRG